MAKTALRRAHNILVPLCLLWVAQIGAAETQIRTRFNVVSPDKKVQYEFVEIIRLGDTDEANIVLIRDVATGDRFVMNRTKSYAEQTSSWKISDEKEEAVVEARFRLPFTKRTRIEALQEARDNPQLSMTPTIVTIETNGGTWSGLDTSWDDWSQLRQLRHEIRRVMSFYLLEGIERMRGSMLKQPAAIGFHQLVARFVLYDTNQNEDAGLQSVSAMPDCDFDKSFGYPCTEAQAKRVKKAVASGKPPARY